MKTKYVWQSPSWPNFTWDATAIAAPLSSVRLAQAHLLGKVAGLGFELHLSERVRVMTEEAVRTSAIEGEMLNLEAVRSSVARRLGLDNVPDKPASRDVEGLIDVLIDATTGFDRPLTADRLCRWHGALFPGGRSGLYEIVAGDFRPAGMPMQVVSGPIGHERVHFEAPPSEVVPAEIQKFVDWFNNPPKGLDGLIVAGIVHFWFVTIHPFQDGNGRLGRAVCEMALARDEGQEQRLYSLSAAIKADRPEYYRLLEKTSKDTGDLTSWLTWFLKCLEKAMQMSEIQIDLALAQGRFWQEHAGKSLNERQIKIVRRLFEAGPDGFTGGMTTKKAANLTKASSATAQRDLSDLFAKGLLVQNAAGGRSTSYSLKTV
jgi:Fic family protein